jgi:hypothetical protein
LGRDGVHFILIGDMQPHIKSGQYILHFKAIAVPKKFYSLWRRGGEAGANAGFPNTGYFTELDINTIPKTILNFPTV